MIITGVLEEKEKNKNNSSQDTHSCTPATHCNMMTPETAKCTHILLLIAHECSYLQQTQELVLNHQLIIVLY